MIHFDDLAYATEVKAETLIARMDIKENFHVRMGGIFSRNYSEDLICVEEKDDQPVFTLSRDGMFHLLPEGLFFEENKIKKFPKNDFEEKYRQFKEEKERIEFFFQQFDTELFKLSVKLDEKLNEILERKSDIFISTFSDVPETETDNKYISGIKAMLPFVNDLKGNFALLADILKNVLSAEKVEIRETQPFHRQFVIHKSGLTKDEFVKMDEELVDFFDFFHQWFLPVEMEYSYRIKDYKTPFILGTTLLLDYNTLL